MSTLLHASYRLGSIELNNRLVMAPMTRCRASADHVPTDIMATYYGQRASAGLIISEGTSPSPNGLGYARMPGLFTDEHVAAWRMVTDEVHAKGGKIFVQLMHTGRVSHSLNMPEGACVLAPSPLAMPGTMWTDAKSMQPYPVPAAMSESDIQNAIAEFAAGAEKAIEAGFDGVELHSANGYLLDQFLNTASNQRTDQWGGSLENRMRFVLEVACAVVARIGAERTGMRISPYGVFNDMKPDAEMEALYEKLAGEVSKLGLVYIHVLDHSSMGSPAVPDTVKQKIRQAFKGTLIVAGGFDAASAEAVLAAKQGDLIAFGKPFIANPDLPRRLREGQELNAPNMNSFYTPGSKGYTDYPALP